MANNSRNSRKEQSGLIKGIVCFVIGAALLVGAFFGGAAYGKHKAETPKDYVQQEQPSGGGLIIGDGENNGLSLMTASIARADFAAYGISEQAESAYTLTATAVDENGSSEGIPQNFTFNASWEDTTNTLPVSDFITITQSANNSVTVSCSRPFNFPIIITVTAAGTNVTATKRCDYLKRLSALDVEVVPTEGYRIDFCGMPVSYKVTPYYYEGTIQGDIELTDGVYKLVQDFYEIMSASTYTSYFLASISSKDYFSKLASGWAIANNLELKIDTENETVFFDWQDIFSYMTEEDFNQLKADTNNCEYFKYTLIEVINNNRAPIDAEYYFNYTYSYNGTVVSSGKTTENGCSFSTYGLGTLPKIANIIVDSDPAGDFVF